jgi:hypothetical protein
VLPVAITIALAAAAGGIYATRARHHDESAVATGQAPAPIPTPSPANAPPAPVTVTLPSPVAVIEAAPPPVRPARHAAAPSVEQRGFLTLDTDPWATVYLGGRRLGTTPFAHVAVPSGGQWLSFDIRNSGTKKRIHVKIAPGKETRQTIRLSR